MIKLEKENIVLLYLEVISVKKFLALLLVILTAFLCTLTGCGNDNSKNEFKAPKKYAYSFIIKNDFEVRVYVGSNDRIVKAISNDKEVNDICKKSNMKGKMSAKALERFIVNMLENEKLKKGDILSVSTDTVMDGELTKDSVLVTAQITVKLAAENANADITVEPEF